MTAAFESTAFEATAFEVSASAAVAATAAIPAAATLALARLTEQFKNKSNIASLVTVLATPSQSLEDALQQLLTLRSIYTATGATLDAIGNIVNQDRNGLVDADYRRYVSARVLANISDGRANQMIAIAKLVINDATIAITYNNIGIAACELAAPSSATSAPVNDALAAIVVAFLRDATSAGVRAVFRYDVAVNDLVFQFLPSAFTTIAIVAADTTITVASTSGLPDSGTLDCELGTVRWDLITYTGRTATTFTGCTGVAHGHILGSAVTARANDAGFDSAAVFSGALST